MAKAAKTQGFLNMVGSLVTVIDKPAPTNKLTAVERMRGNFANHVDEQVKLIQSAAESSRWFKKTPDGYVLTLRNGNAALVLNGSAYFKAENAEKAVAFLVAAKEAAKAGELDDVLEATQRKKADKVEQAA